MPAPSGMFGRNISSDSSQQQHELSNFQRSTGDFNESVWSTSHRRSSSTGSSPPTNQRLYDETFTSNPVTEVKSMLWEIRDFSMIYENRVERAMNFEFEVGRLGSMERHLPRRSRWKILFDVGDSCRRIPALRVTQISPENKTIFYKLEACIMEGCGALVERETGFKIFQSGFKEGISDTTSAENVFPFQFRPTASTLPGDEIGGSDFLDRVRHYIYNGSLFIKVKIEILEDSSTSSQ